MDLSSYKHIQLQRDGKVLTATFNRPEVLNAFFTPMEHEFLRLMDEVSSDPLTNVLVLTGAGRAFSAGGDIDEMQTIIDKPVGMWNAIPNAKKTVFSMLECTKPIIAKVNGHAMGLGATIALFSDITFAANHAKIADPHVAVGFVAGDGGAVIWPQLVGYNRAKEFLFTGDHLLAPEAERLGLINHAVPAEELDKAVNDYAQRVAGMPNRALQWTKASINIGLKQLAHSIMDASMAYEALSNHTADHAEAVAAFRAKRKPSFKGD